MWDRGYDQMIATIKERFGIELELYNTGGWCMVYQARLEGGAVIWISDYDAGVIPRDERLALEGAGTSVGWNVSIYRADADGYPDNAILASAQHETALVAELPGLIELALGSVPHNAQHHFAKGGTHTVTYGVMEF